MTERVYITGFMGSGKTTAGRKIADELGWGFTDLDQLIETGAGKSIIKIFAEEGEDHFRLLEAEALREVSTYHNHVIATGGGAPCYGTNMDLMKKTGLTIYLKMTPLQLASRLLKSRGERPLLAGIPDCDVEGYIKSKLNSREPWYVRADLIIGGFDPDIKAIVKIITDNNS
jgi:shikimate kinase